MILRLAQTPALWGLRFPKGTWRFTTLPWIADTGRRVCASLEPHQLTQFLRLPVVLLVVGGAGLLLRRGGRRAVPTRGETHVHNSTDYQMKRLAVKAKVIRYTGVEQRKARVATTLHPMSRLA